MPDGDVEIRFEVNTDESVKEYNNAYKVENKKISERLFKQCSHQDN